MGFDDTPIERKFMLVNFLTSLVVLSVTCIAFFAYESHIFRQTTMAKVTSIAQITAANTAVPLADDDAVAAAEMLSALEVEGYIVVAVLYDSAGRPFAQYPANHNLEKLNIPTTLAGLLYTDDHLEGNLPVVKNTKQLGTLYLKSNLNAWDERMELYRIVVLFVLILSLLFAWILSLFLSKNISGPIAALSDTAAAVSKHRDYSVRAKKQRNDELGILTDAFNHMLEQIQAQNNTLSDFNKSLEQKVEERTRELNIALKEQKQTESELQEKHREVSLALEELGKAKEMLIVLNNELEQRVKTRTAELEKANADLDDFLYTASHDLKSPISNLEALVVVVKEEFKDVASASQLRFLDMMISSVKRVRKVIQDLNEISKIQKNFDNKAELVLFHRTIEEVKEDVMAGCEDPSITIKEELDVPRITYPAKGFRTIIYNLISNAVKYRSPERPTQIKIKTFLENGSVVLAVEDNGLGIQRYNLPKMFGMFQRFHSHVEGTGIGLYIVKRIVENRGGRIIFISTGEGGSVFKVYF